MVVDATGCFGSLRSAASANKKGAWEPPQTPPSTKPKSESNLAGLLENIAYQIKRRKPDRKPLPIQRKIHSEKETVTVSRLSGGEGSYSFLGSEICCIKRRVHERNNSYYRQLGRLYLRSRELEYSKGECFLQLSEVATLLRLSKEGRKSERESLQLLAGILEARERRKAGANTARLQGLPVTKPKLKTHELSRLTGLSSKRVRDLIDNPPLPYREFFREEVSDENVYWLRDHLPLRASKGFTGIYIPRRILRAMAIGELTRVETLTLLCVFLRKMPYRFFRARIKQSDIADTTGYSERHIRRAINSLIAKNYLRRSKHANQTWMVQYHGGTSYELPDQNFESPSMRRPVRKRQVVKPRAPDLSSMSGPNNKNPIFKKNRLNKILIRGEMDSDPPDRARIDRREYLKQVPEAYRKDRVYRPLEDFNPDREDSGFKAIGDLLGKEKKQESKKCISGLKRDRPLVYKAWEENGKVMYGLPDGSSMSMEEYNAKYAC